MSIDLFSRYSFIFRLLARAGRLHAKYTHPHICAHKPLNLLTARATIWMFPCHNMPTCTFIFRLSAWLIDSYSSTGSKVKPLLVRFFQPIQIRLEFESYLIFWPTRITHSSTPGARFILPNPYLQAFVDLPCTPKCRVRSGPPLSSAYFGRTARLQRFAHPNTLADHTCVHYPTGVFLGTWLAPGQPHPRTPFRLPLLCSRC